MRCRYQWQDDGDGLVVTVTLDARGNGSDPVARIWRVFEVPAILGSLIWFGARTSEPYSETA